ncbi:hypothetical protein NXX38_16980 [Bacteroides sp. BFG-637]|uniref:hypothetical protein n=1 Tax=Bacteroides sp. BFG-637 TaxID=2972764 RepID=UPI002166A2BD|nr:hypothetical protein [Bacteroides sp. BFG-637]MCS3313495.1 hypothetical protein [Bacteroides sp. BFG-637]
MHKAESYPEHEWEWDKTPEETNPGIVELGWTAQYQLGKLPTYISIYKSPEQFESKKAVAYIAVKDMSVSFSVLGEKTGSKTPSQFYEQSQHSVILNGGFFWDGSSLSMICRDGQVILSEQSIGFRGLGNDLLSYKSCLWTYDRW